MSACLCILPDPDVRPEYGIPATVYAAMRAEERSRCPEHGAPRCAFVGCEAPAEAGGFCAACHEWAYVTLADPRYRTEPVPSRGRV